jgi:hypothetical protein
MLEGMKFTLIPRAQVAEVLESEPQPAGGLPAKYIVTLTAEEREQLPALTQAGRIAAYLRRIKSVRRPKTSQTFRQHHLEYR